MPRKKLIYLQLYSKDYTGDERLRWCSPAAWGVYSYLLCLLNTAEKRGCLQLSKLEQRPHLKRSLTQRVLTATTDRARLVPFAELLQRQMPWKRSEILKALRELYQYRVITIEGDSLIQPRMYRDSGYKLKEKQKSEPPEVIDVPTTPQPHEDAPAPPAAAVQPAAVQPAAEPTTPPITPPATISPSSDEPHCGAAPSPNPKPTKPKKPKPSLPFQDFWDLYDKKRDRPASERLWAALSKRDQQAIMDYIPQYIESQPEKRFRKDPTTFLRHRSWEDELIINHPKNKPKQNLTILQPQQVQADEVEEW